MEFLLFERDPVRAARAAAAGVHGLVCDWETRGKAERQMGADLEENADTPDDVRRVAAVARVVCRINGVWDGTPAEVEAALEAGAGLVLVPMVRAPEEPRRVIELVAGRAEVGILVETREAVERARELATMPLGMVYVGFNDLRLERGTGLFTPLVDGTIDRVRDAFPAHRFGFAGLTVVDGGSPLPCRLLLAEMARLDCAFAFLRRSFKRDVAGRDMSAELSRLRAAWEQARARDAGQVASDRAELLERVRAL